MHPNLPVPLNLLHELKHKGIVEADCSIAERWQGTTLGTVYLLKAADRPAYVLKIDDPQQIYITARFLNGYSGNLLLPRLMYADPQNEFLLYAYIPGTPAGSDRGSKREWLRTVTERLISAYVQPEEHHGWGWMDEPADSWPDFMQERLQEAYALLDERLPEEDHARIRELGRRHSQTVVEAGETGTQPAYWLHGDCGAHNFLFEAGELRGVIDPSPMIGPPLYELAFAFCSSPDDLRPETLLEASRSLTNEADQPLYPEPEPVLTEGFLQLYLRMASCLRHHPEDWPAYREAWEHWKKLPF